MRRLLLISILIVSALLLTAVKNGQSASVQSTPQANQPNNDQRVSQPSPSGIETIQPDPARDLSDDADREADIQARIAALTRWLVLAAFLQVVASGLAARATRQAANAADNSAEAARLALRSERPYLILEHAQMTGVLRGDDPVTKETPQLDELKKPPMFFPRVVLTFHNYGGGPVIFGEGLIRIDALSQLPPPRDFSGCERMGLQANAVKVGEEWHPLAQFNFDADWAALFPDIATGKKWLVAYGCIRYSDRIGKDTYETGFCWIFTPPRTEVMDMPKVVKDLLAPYRAPDAPHPDLPHTLKMPGDFRRGPKTHNYND